MGMNPRANIFFLISLTNKGKLLKLFSTAVLFMAGWRAISNGEMMKLRMEKGRWMAEVETQREINLTTA